MKSISLLKIILLNLLVAGMSVIPFPQGQINIILELIFAINSICIIFCLKDVNSFLRKREGSFFMGRRRTLITFYCCGLMMLAVFAFTFELIPALFFAFVACYTVVVLIIEKKADKITPVLHRWLKPDRRIALVGNTETAREFIQALKRRPGYSLEDYFDTLQSLKTGSSATNYWDQYIRTAREKNITEFYVSLPKEYQTQMAELTRQAEKHCIRVHFLDAHTSPTNEMYKIHYIGGRQVLKQYTEPLRRRRNRWIKRGFDIVISSLVIILVLSWLIPLVGLFILVESKGGIFFSQLRSGRDNNEFYCLKFRSMRPNTTSNVRQASRNDRRITRVGAFLRKTSLDELPQFINVFLGDMSIAGPRPHMLRHTEEYSEMVNHYMVRLYLKPGITGWAQAHGYRGEITDVDLIKKRVEHDLWYMENWNLFLDIKILFLTVLAVFKRMGNAY